MVLDGTFSIEEIDVKSSARRKAAKTTKKKATTKASNKAAGRAKTASKTKTASKPKTVRKPTAVEPGTVVLECSPGIKNVIELKDTLAAAHGAGAAVSVDASAVEFIDTAALQLLIAFANSMREKSRTVEWKNPSPVFCEMADLADLTQGLGIHADGPVAEEDDGLCPVF